MKKRTIIAITLLVLLSTITSQQKFVTTKFNLNKIIVTNNYLVDNKEIKKLLSPFNNKSLILLKDEEIKQALLKNSLIESFKIKKKYPNTLKIQIFEKKPIAVLQNKKQKFLLSEKIDLIEFKYFQKNENLPYVFGNKEKFKIFYLNLKKINFPLEVINKYTLFETNRWDIETKDNKVIKLPSEDYLKILENYLDLRNKKDFKKYRMFDYRIKDQLILN